MSSIKRVMEEKEEHDALARCLRYLLDSEEIEGEAAQGIAHFVIKNGVEGLSQKQRKVFDSFVSIHIPKICPSCENPAQTHDLYEILTGGFCTDCTASKSSWAKID